MNKTPSPTSTAGLPRRRRLAWKLLGALVGLSIVPLLVAGAAAYVGLRQQIQLEAQTTLDVTADGAAATIREFLESLRGRTRDVAADWYIRGSLERGRLGAELDRYLEVNRELVPESVAVLVAGLDGRIVAASDRRALGTSVAGAPYFAAGRRDVYIGDVVRDGDDRLDWVVAAPITSRRSGTPPAILVLHVDPRTLDDITTGRKMLAHGARTDAMRRGRTGEVYIVNRDRLMVTESRFVPDAILRERVQTEAVRRAFRNGRFHGAYPDYRGVSIMGTSVLLREMGWVVVAEQDLAEGFLPVRRLRNEMLALGVVVLAAVAGLGLVLQRSILRPMDRVLEADTRVMAAGPAAGLLDEDRLPDDEWKLVVAMRNRMLRRVDEQSRWLAADAERRRREADALGGVAARINAEADAPEILAAIADAARQLCDADVADLGLRDAGAPLVSVRTAGPGADAARLAPTVAPALAAAHAALRADVAAEAPPLPPAAVDRLRASGLTAVAAVPIAVQDTVIGVLAVGVRGRRAFTERDVEVLRRLADQAAIAVESRRLVEELRARQEHLERLLAEARDAEQLKDRFLAMLSRELRNPLATVVNAVHVLERGDIDDARRAEMRAILARQSRHLGRLVEDLLDVARIRSGKVRLQRERVDLRDVGRRALDSLRNAGRADEHTITLDTAPEPVPIDGDPVRLEQVARNLLDNAVKYTPAGRAIHLAVGVDGGDAVLQVRDEGVGIEPGMLQMIFQPFAQAESSLERTRGGLGLGLAVVRDLVAQHGGRVVAQSDGPERGRTFVVRLPRAAALAAPTSDDAADAVAPLRILVVEDNADARATLAALLSGEGHRVETAADGLEGLRLALASPPDVAVVDIGLPGIDGYALARHLRATREGKRVRLVAVTGYGQPGDVQRALEAGFDVHLVKPVDAGDLTRALFRAA